MVTGYSQRKNHHDTIRKNGVKTRFFQLLCAMFLLAMFLFLSASHSFLYSTASVYAQGDSKLLIDLAVDVPEPEPGLTFVYTIRYRCASLTDNCINTVVSNVLPDYLEIVGYTTANGNVSSTNVTDNGVTWELESAINMPGQLDAGSAGMLFLRVRFPACSDDAVPMALSEFDNVATISEDGGAEISSNAGTATVTIPAIPICTVPAEPPAGDFLMSDAGQPVVAPGNIDITYDVMLLTSPEEPYHIDTTIPEGLTMRKFETDAILSAGGEVTITCGGTEVSLAATLTGDLNRADDVPAACTIEQALGSDNAVLFTNLESITVTIPAGVEFPDPIEIVYSLDDNYPVGDVVRNEMRFIEPDGLDLNNDGSIGTTMISIVDKAILDSSLMGSIEVNNFVTPGFIGSNGEPILNSNGTLPQQIATTKTTHKNLNLDSVYLAKNDIVWQMRAQLRNDGSEGLDWEDPLFVHDLPAEVDFVVDPETGNFVQMAILNMNNISPEYDPYNQAECHSPELTTTPNFEGSGRTRVEMRFPGCTIYGGMQQYAGLSFYISGRMKPGVLAASTLTSNFRMVSENGPEMRCFGFDISFEPYCETSSKIEVTLVNSVDTYAYAKGAYDARFQRYPSMGYTNNDGTADYELYIFNSGNIAHTSLELVDILPFDGDTSVIGSQSRGSTWNMELAGDVVVEKLNPQTREWEEVPAEEFSTPVRYSSSTNPCRLNASGYELRVDETLSVAPNDCDTMPWSNFASTADSARSFGLTYQPAGGFAPDNELRVSFQSRYISPLKACVGIVDEDFGSGIGRAEAPASATPSYTFDGSETLRQGEYMLANAVTLDDGIWWHSAAEDHTEGDIDGRMLIAASSDTPGEFYRTTMDGLEAGNTYLLSFWVANADDNDTAALPNIKLSVEPAGGGGEIASHTTGAIPNSASLLWQEYSFTLTAAATSHDLVLSTQ